MTFMESPDSGLRNSRWILAAIGAAFVLAACSSEDAAFQMPVPEVTVMVAESGPAAVRQTYSGRLHGAREVDVRSRVGGIIIERLYEEGQYVERDQPLFRIDPEPFQIVLQRARAEQANARAAFNQADREWTRLSRLFEREAVSQREYDRALAEHELGQARLAQADAAVRHAELNLQWTSVASPVSGVTGLEILSEGNLISEGMLLTRITQLDPIQFRFSMPEDDAKTRQTAIRQARSDDEISPAVQLTLPDGSTYALEGVLDFVDSRVDLATGSVTARATFPNPEGILVPGQFVRGTLQIQHLDNVARVPRGSVRHGRDGPHVLLVVGDRIELRLVTLGPVVNGEQVLLDGVRAGEQVVTSGLAALQPGMSVRVRRDN